MNSLVSEERAVGDQRLTVAHADRLCRLGLVERLAGDIDAARDRVLDPRVDVVPHRSGRLRGARLTLDTDQLQILHRAHLRTGFALMSIRRTQRRRMDSLSEAELLERRGEVANLCGRWRLGGGLSAESREAQRRADVIARPRFEVGESQAADQASDGVERDPGVLIRHRAGRVPCDLAQDVGRAQRATEAQIGDARLEPGCRRRQFARQTRRAPARTPRGPRERPVSATVPRARTGPGASPRG